MHRKRCLLRFSSIVGLALLGVIACDDAPIPTQKIITGTAQLSQAAPLPQGSRLQVILEDVSRADIAAQPLADMEQDATTLAFALAYNHNLIQTNKRYNLRARIIDARGKLLWTTDTQRLLPLTDAPIALKLIPITTALATRQSLFFQCEKQDLLVKIEGESAALFLGERVFALSRVASASGIHFQSEEADFWSKGDEAILSVAGESRRHCSLRPQALSLALAAQAGSTLWASGNEPPWLLIRNGDDTLTLTRQYGADILVIKGVTEAITDTGVAQLEAKTAAGKLAVRIVPQKCADSMEGKEYTLKVAIQLDDIELQGCGQHLSWPMSPLSRLPAEQ